MKQFFLFCLTLITIQLSAQVDTFSYKEIADLSYLAPEDRVVDSLQQLDLVLPEGVDNPPLFIWIGGGAWSFVNRKMERNLARKFARAGIAVAAVGHQLSRGEFSNKAHATGVKHPAHVKDVAAALKWLYDNAADYGYDKENIFVGGFSSGAHLSALLAMDEQYIKAHKLNQSHIRAIIPVAGTYDINHYYGVFANHERAETRAMAKTHVMDVFGEENGFEAASPATYLDKLKIPMLLISEGGLFNYTKEFEQRIWESDYRNCQILHVFNKDHAGLWRDISNADNSQTRNAMIDFIQRNTVRQDG